MNYDTIVVNVDKLNLLVYYKITSLMDFGIPDRMYCNITDNWPLKAEYHSFFNWCIAKTIERVFSINVTYYVECHVEEFRFIIAYDRYLKNIFEDFFMNDANNLTSVFNKNHEYFVEVMGNDVFITRRRIARDKRDYKRSQFISIIFQNRG